MTKVAAVVLAAGGSRRMGVPKQLLRWGHSTLLSHAVSTARASLCSEVVVVLGAYRDRIEPEIQGPGIRVLPNPDWREGLGSSIRAAVRELHDANAAVLLLADQPFITPEIIDRLVEVYRRGGKPVVASVAGGRPCPPALFASSLFPELSALRGDVGVREVIDRDPARVLRISVPEAAADCDTITRYFELCP